MLADVRRIALALPEATEVEAWGRPTFRAGKIFAIYSGDSGHEFSLVITPEPNEREALLHDPRFYAPPYFGVAGWLALDLTSAPIDWTEIGELLEASYRQVAGKRMLAALDASTRPDPRG